METEDAIERAMAIRTEELYRDSFARGIPMYYKDKRVSPPKEFIRANADGSEDLVSFDLNTREYKLIKKLAAAGKGHWAYVLPVVVHG